MVIDPEKLAKLQKQSSKKVGGQRVKAKKVNKSSEGDDSKVQAALAKFNPTTLTDVAEANFFRDDGSVLHFNRVGVQACAANNTYAVTGFGQEKQITELLPGILTQLGAENLELLQKLAQSFQQNPESLAKLQQGGAKEEDIPELVEGETFDDVE
mgnify:FL=1|jgi:nascent polypeptide-associated complex subunit beta